MTRRLVADVGGTNARFSLVEHGVAGPVLRLRAADHPSFDSALDTSVRALAAAGSIGECAIAAAGPVRDGQIDVTNLPWVIRADAVADRLGVRSVRLVNDLEAVALALPALGPGDTVAVRPGVPAIDRPRLAVNVGTGFGAALAVRAPPGWIAVAGEPGHMRLGATSPEEVEQFCGLDSVESLLSGDGLVTLARRLGSRATTPVEVATAADPIADRARRMFARALGRIAGDLALAMGAWGGVYLCGGVIAHPLGPRFDESLIAAFDDKGAMAGPISSVPIHRITAPDPAIIGLATLDIAG